MKNLFVGWARIALTRAQLVGFWLLLLLMQGFAIGLALALPSTEFVYLYSLIVWWLLLAMIDAASWLLPHFLTRSLAVYSVLLATLTEHMHVFDSLLGAGLGYFGLWLLNWCSIRYCGQAGFGGGDFYFSAALGCWFGWYNVPHLWLVAALVSLLWALCLWLYTTSKPKHVPFGPGLSASAVWLLLYP